MNLISESNWKYFPAYRERPLASASKGSSAKEEGGADDVDSENVGPVAEMSDSATDSGGGISGSVPDDESTDSDSAPDKELAEYDPVSGEELSYQDRVPGYKSSASFIGYELPTYPAPKADKPERASNPVNFIEYVPVRNSALGSVSPSFPGLGVSRFNNKNSPSEITDSKHLSTAGQVLVYQLLGLPFPAELIPELSIMKPYKADFSFMLELIKA